KTAVAHIERKGDDIELYVDLQNGSRFGRVLGAGPEASVGSTRFGPEKFPSPIKEDPKFMTLEHLKDLYEHPEKSVRLQGDVTELIKEEQASGMLEKIRAALNGPSLSYK